MPYYRAIDRSDRAKALAGVLLVHVALAAVILSGLNVRSVGEAVERLKTFDIREAPPPPRIEPPPPPQPEQSGAPEEEAAPANIQSRPTPVVAPEPRVSLPVPLPMNVAQVPGPEGADRTAGASNVPGSGTGAGGQGSGFGGGGAGGTGSGSGSGEGLGSEARLLGGHRARLGSSFLRSVGVSRGAVPLRLTISATGRVTSCRPLRTSGSTQLDAELCRIMRTRSRWSPATDRAGRPVSVELTYVATFSE